MEFFLWIGIFSLPALLVGLLVKRWWVVLLTIGVYVLFSLVYPHLYSESYSNSSDFNSASSYSIVLLGLIGLPAAMAAGVGFAVRVLVRWIVHNRPTLPPLRDWPRFLDWPLRRLEEERRIARDTQAMTGKARRSGHGR